MIEIAAFGKVSVGKSALLNAIFSTDAFIVDVRAGSTDSVRKIQASLGEQKLVVVDTPGIGDIAGPQRTQAAQRAVQTVELVLVVCDSDLTDSEYTAIQSVAQFGKPILVVLNKADALDSRDRRVLIAQIRKRLKDIVEPTNVLLCAANPLKHYARVDTSGNLEEWTARATPDVSGVRSRIIQILHLEGEDLRQLNKLAQQADIEVLRRETAKARADSIIDEYALGVAVGVAVNPVPLLDLFGGGTAVVVLIGKLAECHSVDIREGEIKKLAQLLITQGWRELWPSVVPIVAGALLKSIPFVGWAIGALGQATGAYYITYIVGKTCSEYFSRNMQWVESVEETLRQVIAHTDKRSVSRNAATRIKARVESLGR
ncbi:MAG: GTP-binding protein [Chloroflexota bacterium]|nr:GTP-binding protein [Chloroflexota bacterium]MDQ5865758.1 GTP-binding protein [Chloroflexota bacterium]